VDDESRLADLAEAVPKIDCVVRLQDLGRSLCAGAKDDVPQPGFEVFAFGLRKDQIDEEIQCLRKVRAQPLDESAHLRAVEALNGTVDDHDAVEASWLPKPGFDCHSRVVGVAGDHASIHAPRVEHRKQRLDAVLMSNSLGRRLGLANAVVVEGYDPPMPAEFTGTGGVRERWKSLSLDQRRVIVRTAFKKVVIAPGKPGRPSFDSDRIQAGWAV